MGLRPSSQNFTVIEFLVFSAFHMIFYAVQPTAGMTVIKQIIFDSILIVILGLVVAFLNKPQAAATE